MTAADWWLCVGGACQFFGVLLLIIGLDRTRRAFDLSRAGLVGATVGSAKEASQRLLRSARGLLARLPGRGRHQDGLVTPAPVVITARVDGGDLKIVPHLDISDPVAAIKEVHRRLYAVQEDLLGRVGKTRQEAAGLVQGEAAARGQDIRGLRLDLSRLALGGLAGEAWAAVLILLGVAITTIASVLA